MTETPAYLVGAVDALALAGAVSPEYASGVRSVLEKRAAWWWDTPAEQRYRAEIDAIAERNAVNGKPNYGYFSPDEAAAAVDRSRHWWEKIPWAWNYAKQAVKGGLNALDDTSAKTWDDYMLDYNRYRAQDRQKYIAAHLDNDRQAGYQRSLAAAYDRNNRDINDFITGSHRFATDDMRRSMGLTAGNENIEMTPGVRSSIQGGLYKLRDNFGERPKVPVEYGRGLYKMYGDNAKLLPSNVAALDPQR